MHGLSSTSSAFVAPRGMIDIGTSSSSSSSWGRVEQHNDEHRFRPEPLAMMMPTGMEGELFGLVKDTLTAASTGGAGDIIAQLAEKKNSEDPDVVDMNNPFPKDNNFQKEPFELDVRRTLSYCTFAAGYTGAFQHFLFANLQDAIPDPVTRLALNQGLIIPLCYYSLLVLLVPKLRGKTPEEEQQLRSSINVPKMIPRNWAFWVPLQFIQFNFIPTDFQVIYCSLCGLVWNVLLSFFTAGASKDATVPAEEAAPLLQKAVAGGGTLMDVSIAYSDEPDLKVESDLVGATPKASVNSIVTGAREGTSSRLPQFVNGTFSEAIPSSDPARP